MQILKPVDVAIVGGGWTGLMMAKEIATRTGLTVAVLERGGPPRVCLLSPQLPTLEWREGST